MSHLLTILTLAIAVLFISSQGRAQQAPQATLQFVSFPKSNSPQPVELLIGDGQTIEVKIPSNDLSDPYPVPLLTTWSVGKTEMDADKKMVFNSYAKAPALTSKKQLIILIRKGATNAEGMEMIPIESDNTNFTGGKFLFLNTAKVDIAGQVGEQKFIIKPGNQSIIEPKPVDNAKVFHAVFYFRKDNEAKPFFSSKWPVNDKARSLIFFYHDTNNQRLRFHTIRNFITD